MQPTTWRLWHLHNLQLPIFCLAFLEYYSSSFMYCNHFISDISFSKKNVSKPQNLQLAFNLKMLILNLFLVIKQ